MEIKPLEEGSQFLIDQTTGNLVGVQSAEGEEKSMTIVVSTEQYNADPEAVTKAMDEAFKKMFENN